MADNFLENRMDDYKKGRLNTNRPFISSKTTKLQPSVLVICGENENTIKTIMELRNKNWRVAFIFNNEKRGRVIAQQTGSQFHPIDYKNIESLRKSIEYIVKRWGCLNLILDYSGDFISENISSLLSSFSIAYLNLTTDLYEK